MGRVEVKDEALGYIVRIKVNNDTNSNPTRYCEMMDWGEKTQCHLCPSKIECNHDENDSVSSESPPMFVD